MWVAVKLNNMFVLVAHVRSCGSFYCVSQSPVGTVNDRMTGTDGAKLLNGFVTEGGAQEWERAPRAQTDRRRTTDAEAGESD